MLYKKFRQCNAITVRNTQTSCVATCRGSYYNARSETCGIRKGFLMLQEMEPLKFKLLIVKVV